MQVEWCRIASHSAGLKKFVSATPVADDGDSQALVVATGWQLGYTLILGNSALYNRSGAICPVGLAVRLSRHRWGAGQVTAAGVFTDDTTDAQDAGAGDFLMHDRTNSGSGFVIHAECPFNVVSIVQGVAGDQTTPVLLLEVWDGAGWVNIVAANYSDDDLNPGATNERLIVFPIPSFWVIGGSGTGIRQDRYNLRIRHTHSGAGTVNPQAAQIFVGVSLLLAPAVADGGIANLAPQQDLPSHRFGDALFPIFGTPGYENQVDVSYYFG
jgi:hypothetical protein